MIIIIIILMLILILQSLSTASANQLKWCKGCGKSKRKGGKRRAWSRGADGLVAATKKKNIYIYIYIYIYSCGKTIQSAEYELLLLIVIIGAQGQPAEMV